MAGAFSRDAFSSDAFSTDDAPGAIAAPGLMCVAVAVAAFNTGITATGFATSVRQSDAAFTVFVEALDCE